MKGRKAMKRKDLETLGLDKESIDKIMSWNGADIEAEKAKTTAVENERDNYKAQLDTAKESLDKFKDVDVDGMNEQIAKLKDDLKAKDEEYAAKEADRMFTDSVRAAIKAAGGRNDKAVMALLDLEALKASKNQTEDIKKALDAAKESDAYLFGADEPINNPVAGTGSGKGSSLSAVARAMGLTEKDME